MIAGISIVRDEGDVIGITLAHHVREGLGLLLVVDNNSTDETRSILRAAAAADERIVWFRDSSDAFHQAEVLTGLAHEAVKRGATWIVPFDADEFWHAERGGIARALAHRNETALEVRVCNYVQRRTQTALVPDALIGVTHRIARPVGPPGSPEHVGDGSISYVAMEYPTKWIRRAQPDMAITPGNHTLENVEGTTDTLENVRCLHVPLRARDILEKKAEHGRRLAAAGYPPLHGWHVQRIARLAEEKALDREWTRNSHEDGVLLAPNGGVVDLVRDTTVRDLVAPLVPRSGRRRRLPRLRAR